MESFRWAHVELSTNNSSLTTENMSSAPAVVVEAVDGVVDAVEAEEAAAVVEAVDFQGTTTP
jgi:hypothetical protein